MSDYDKMRNCDLVDDDAPEDDEILEQSNEVKKSARDEYFDFYDDIKTSIKEDW